MKRTIVVVALSVGWLACGGPQKSAGGASASGGECPTVLPDAKSFAEGQQQIVMRAEALTWGPCPPSVPFACEMAVLEGSPKGEGLFTMRMRTTEPWVMPPHTHPRSERVTVLSGKIGVGFGTAVDKTQGQSYGPGDYYVNAAGAVHFVFAEEPVEIQITGIGPWEVHPHK